MPGTGVTTVNNTGTVPVPLDFGGKRERKQKVLNYKEDKRGTEIEYNGGTYGCADSWRIAFWAQNSV